MLWLAQPTARSLAIGAVVAAIGEAIRIWAAGHLEKGREVTMSGPYAFTRHPLYLGSSLIGIGFAIASASAVAAALVFAYLARDAHRRDSDRGSASDREVRRRVSGVSRRTRGCRARDVSAPARVMRNREYRALLGLVFVLVVLALKVRIRW